jgi:hypothetical protein
MDLRKVGMEGADWIILAQEWDQWLDLLYKTISLLVS